MSWRINNKIAAEIGAADLTLTHRSLADGEFSFTAQGRNIDTAPLFTHLQTVKLTGPGGERWRGPCIRRKVVGTGGGEDHHYTAASPWWYLDQQTYLQRWKINGDEAGKTVLLSRCILGLNSDGSRQTMGEVITHVVNFCRASGWPIATGTISLPGFFPVEEINGLKCSEVIRSVLRWAPDAVGWWTFGETSRLHIRRRKDLARKTLTVGQAPLYAVDISPREDMMPGAVVIQYERGNTIDGNEVFQTSADAAPPGADGTEKGAVHLTIPLGGATATYIKQRVTVATIERETSGAANGARRYWGRILGLVGKVKAVEGASPETPEIFFQKLASGEYFERSLVNVHGADANGDFELRFPNLDANDPKNEKTYLLDDLPRELVGGTVFEWMTGVRAQDQFIRFKISYTGKDGKFVPSHEQTVRMVATDATNREYSQIESLTAGEEPTNGLAAQMLEALTTPHFEGRVQLVAEECPETPGLGNRLRIFGGAVGWETMDAVIQTVTENIDSGERTLTIGPPEHLGAQDIIELQRCNRRVEGNTGAKASNQTRRSGGFL